MADPPSFNIGVEATKLAWLDPRGTVYPVTNHNEIYKLLPGIGSWNDAFDRGWVRLGTSFGIHYVHGPPATIDRNRDLIVLYHRESKKELLLEFVFSRFIPKTSFFVSMNDFLEMSTSDLYRRQRIIEGRRRPRRAISVRSHPRRTR